MEIEVLANKYQILENIGNGHFGSVSKGICIRTRKRVAIKMEERSDHGLLKHEATVLHYLDSQKCKNIPFLYYYGFHRNTVVYIVMSYYAHGSLDQLRQSMDEEEKIGWWNTALDILEHIHKAGIVHRDLKPQHFMRDEQYEWHLIDFGLATSFLDDSQEHIKEVPKDNIVGSPNYVSWFVHGGRDVVRRDDFLSTIYILWELFWGSYLDTNSSVQISTDVLNDFNAWLREQKDFSRFYEKLAREDGERGPMMDFMVSLLSHAEQLKFKDKPNYSLFVLSPIVQIPL